MTFEEQLALGNLGERLVERALHERQCGTVASYLFSGTDGAKAPRLMFSDHGHVIPDLDVCKEGRRFWAEVKTYWHAPENRTYGIHVHGIDRRLYNDYLAVERATGCPVYILVLEVSTGWLLSTKLASTRIYPCICTGCKAQPERRCTAPLTKGVYWNRNAMRRIGVFPDEDMAHLRVRWTKPWSAT